MMTLKNIPIATDFSEASEAALVYARELAHAFTGTLHVLHVTDNVLAGAIGVEGYTIDWAALQREVDEAPPVSNWTGSSLKKTGRHSPRRPS